MAQPFPALDVAGQTDVGLKRTRNEDSFIVLTPPAGSPQVSQGAMFIVADGMGGMGGGDVASKTAIDVIVKTFYDPSVTNAYDPLPRLKDALEAANVSVREAAQTVGLPRIGATGAGMILTATGDAVVFNIGDSRVYRARGSYIELLTRDQSVMASQLEAGLVSQEEAKLSRNVNVTAFIGQPMQISPVYSRMQTQPGDVFIICSDGLWDLVEPNELLKAVQSPAKEAASKLIAMVRQRGAPDNVTVIIVRVGAAARPLPLIPLAVAGLIVLAALGGFVLARSGAFTDNRPAPTETAIVAMTSAPASATVPAVVVAVTQEMTPEITIEPSQLISISLDTTTPEMTSTVAATPTTEVAAETAAAIAAVPTNTSTPAATPTRQATATPALTSTATATATDSPTTTATPTTADTATPTVTSSPEPSATPPPTTIPSATTPPEPTVTLNPTVITFTPAPRPTGAPTEPAVSAASHDAFLLVVAQGDGVILSGGATLYLFDESATPEVTIDALAYVETNSVTTTPEASAEATSETTATAEVTAGAQLSLDAGTHLQLLGDGAQPAPAPGTGILVHVVVTSGDHIGELGWIGLQALLQASPAVPYVLPSSNVIRGVNVRSGEGQLSSVIDVLLPGEYARLVAVSTSPLGWYYVELTSGGHGWVSPGNVSVEGDMTGIKRLTPPPTPTFTPSPTDTPVPLPTLTGVAAG